MLVLLCFSADASWLRTNPEDKEIIYIVSTRPLADVYAHPLATQLAAKTDSYVYGLYLGMDNGAGTSSEQSMYTVAIDVEQMEPNLLILDDVVASNYLMKLLPEGYIDKTLFLSKSRLNLDDANKSKALRIDNVAIQIINLVREMHMFPESYYILYDDSGLTASEASILKRNLSPLGVGNIQTFEISTIQELDDTLYELNKKPKGILINTIMSLVDGEFGQRIRLEQIKQNIVSRNVRHLEIGFNYLPGTENESVILELDYSVFVDKFFGQGLSPTNIRIPFRVILNKKQMTRLGMKKNYIAAHESINVLVE